MDAVVGNGTDIATATAKNLDKGYYFATVRPISGSTNGETVTCTLTISN